jgi:hypothetical protein
MMQCRDIEELMVDFLYQELDEPHAKAFEEHVHGCAHCEAELSSLARTRQALRALPEAEPSPAVSARLLHEAARRAPKPEEERRGVGAWLRDLFAPLARHPAWASAVASVIIVAGLASVLTLQKKSVTPGPELASRSVPAAEPAPEPKAKPKTAEEAETKAGDKVDEPVAAAAPPTTAPASPAHAADEFGRADKPADVTKAPTVRSGRTSTAREEKALRDAADGTRPALDRAGATAEEGKGGKDSERSQTVAGELKVAPAPAKQAKKEVDDDRNADTPAAQAERPAPTSKLASPPAPVQAPSGYAAGNDELRKADNGKVLNTVGGAAGPAADTRRGTLQQAQSPPPPAPAETTTAPAQVDREADANKKSQLAENQRPDGKADQKPAAKPAPPSPSAELHQQARKQATSGACTDALALRDKIARIDPGYFNKNVAGDPAFRACQDQQQQRAKAKRAAPAESAPRRNDNLESTDKNENKAAH